MIDFNIDISSCPSHVPSLKTSLPLLNCRDIEDWLWTHKPIFGWTFSLTLKNLDYYKVSRLIVGNCKTRVKDKRIKYASNVHMKCYIGRVEMLVGSFNLTAATVEDCCVLIKNREQIKHMKNEFERHWKSL